MTIGQLFTKYLNKNTKVGDAINELVKILDGEAYAFIDNGDDVNVIIADNHIKGFKDNDTFHLTEINGHKISQIH